VVYDTDGLQPAHIITVSAAMEHVAATTLALWHVRTHCVYVCQGALACAAWPHGPRAVACPVLQGISKLFDGLCCQQLVAAMLKPSEASSVTDVASQCMC
jgi:hypothetical protein